MLPKVSELLSVSIGDRDPNWLRESLQMAIEIEHATMPPYLCGMWSIRDGSSPVLSMIRSIIMDEMSHMGLACNMLTTIGGTPRIADPAFIPEYPCPLPGGVRPRNLGDVWLQGLTKDYINQVFMPIEEPEWDPVVPPPRLLEAEEVYPSIGAFYAELRDTYLRLVAEGKVHITGQRQLRSSVGTSGVYPIGSIGEVLKAINEIMEQGEGTESSPTADEQAFAARYASGELAHYYTFAEIYYGKKIIKTPTGWAYEGEPVIMPGTRPMAPVPKGGYPGITDAFNKSYSDMLRNLDLAWRDGDQQALSRAIGNMYQLEGPAIQLMDTPIPGGTGNYGPDFRYVPAE